MKTRLINTERVRTHLNSRRVRFTNGVYCENWLFIHPTAPSIRSGLLGLDTTDAAWFPETQQRHMYLYGPHNVRHSFQRMLWYITTYTTTWACVCVFVYNLINFQQTWLSIRYSKHGRIAFAYMDQLTRIHKHVRHISVNRGTVIRWCIWRWTL